LDSGVKIGQARGLAHKLALFVACIFPVTCSVVCFKLFCVVIREETEIIEGEVVEVQIDRPASGTVSSSCSSDV